MKVLGRGYVIEHCISSLKLYYEEKNFRIYVTDALMAIAENTTHLIGQGGVVDYGKSISQRWIDIMNPQTQKKEPEDDRPSEEIAADIWKRIRGH